jgi:hypothetical protein
MTKVDHSDEYTISDPPIDKVGEMKCTRALIEGDTEII